VARLCVFGKGPKGVAPREKKWAYAHFFFRMGWKLRNRVDRSTLNRREDQIESLISPAVEASGCELWGLEFQSQGRRSRLRIYIERPEGVTVEDCERVSRDVSDLLDVEDVVPGTYVLEVSSPGMDRVLFKADHYQANLGAVVDVRLNFPFEGRKHIVGVLVGLEEDEVIVRPQEESDEGSDGEEFVLPLENIHRARLVPQFD
jgi:ribosome maturation factor RimP